MSIPAQLIKPCVHLLPCRYPINRFNTLCIYIGGYIYHNCGRVRENKIKDRQKQKDVKTVVIQKQDREETEQKPSFDFAHLIRSVFLSALETQTREAVRPLSDSPSLEDRGSVFSTPHTNTRTDHSDISSHLPTVC